MQSPVEENKKGKQGKKRSIAFSPCQPRSCSQQESKGRHCPVPTGLLTVTPINIPHHVSIRLHCTDQCPSHALLHFSHIDANAPFPSMQIPRSTLLLDSCVNSAIYAVPFSKGSLSISLVPCLAASRNERLALYAFSVGIMCMVSTEKQIYPIILQKKKEKKMNAMCYLSQQFRPAPCP